MPAEDGRRLFIGWMSNWDYGQAVPTHPWRSAMTLPRTLVLKKTAAGYRLFSQPVNELEALRSKKTRLKEAVYAGMLDLTDRLGFSPRLSEMVLEFELLEGAPAAFGVELSNSLGERYRVGYNAEENRFFSDRTQAGDSAFSEKFASSAHHAPRLLAGNTVRLHLFFDTSSAELFADGGSVALTDLFFPSEDFSTLKLFAEGGRAKLIGGEAYRLKGIWR